MGSIEVITGPMFSGKTEELIRRVKRAQIGKLEVLTFKPEIDDRYSELDIASHSGIRQEAIVVDNADELSKMIEESRKIAYGCEFYPSVVAVEEIQFFDTKIIQAISSLKAIGIRVIVAGLDMDWRGKPFQITADLLALADKVDKLKAVCTVCGQDASHSFLKNKTGETIQVGASDLYEARCYKHWRGH